MVRRHAASLSFIIVLFVISGCATTTQEISSTAQGLSTTVKSKVNTLTSTVDPALVNQVPADMREGFAKAEFDLKVASEKLKLAELKSEQAAVQKKSFDYAEDMAASFRKEAQIDYDLVKIESIIKAGLGKKEDNLKIRADLHAKKMKTQADRISIQADIDNAKTKNDELAKQITRADEAIKGMQFAK